MAELPTDTASGQPGLFYCSFRQQGAIVRKGAVMKNAVLTEADLVEKGIALFNEGRYFEAQEAWEVPWLTATVAGEKQFLQGLVMVAGAFHHYLRRECEGAALLVKKGLPLVRSSISTHRDLCLSELAADLEDVLDEFESCSLRVPIDALPKIKRMAVGS